MKNSTILINIDESAILGFDKGQIFIETGGSSTKFINISNQGSINIISAIALNEMSITRIKSRTVKVETFIEYMKNFNNYLKSIIGIADEKISIILDNYSVHGSRNARS